MSSSITIMGVAGLPEIRPGDSIPGILLKHMTFPLRDKDILVVASKIISKAEGRIFCKKDIVPSARAARLSAFVGREPEYVELALRETERVVQVARGVMICRTHHGFVLANAGVDSSNTGGEDIYITLPLDPDKSASCLRNELSRLSGCDVGVIISDTFGRAWRKGQTDVAIGCAGAGAFLEYAGTQDRDGKLLKHSFIACADELAGAAELVMRKSDGIPIAIIRGVDLHPAKGAASSIPYAVDEDLFL